MKILILGDSWAADWSGQYDQYQGWPNILAEHHNVTNIAQAGVSQYSICRQLLNTDYSNYDHYIISITSPYRVYTPQHPVHDTGLHKNSDLIYTDLEYHQQEMDTPRLASAVKWFEHHFDTEHAEFTHHLLVDWCLSRLDPRCTTVTSNISGNSDYVAEHRYLDGVTVYESFPGKINHLSSEGNQIFAQQLLDQFV